MLMAKKKLCHFKNNGESVIKPTSETGSRQTLGSGVKSSLTSVFVTPRTVTIPALHLGHLPRIGLNGVPETITRVCCEAAYLESAQV